MRSPKAFKWPCCGHRWSSLDDISLLFHLSLLESDFHAQIKATRRGPRSDSDKDVPELSSFTVRFGTPSGVELFKLAVVTEKKPKVYVVSQVASRQSVVKQLKLLQRSQAVESRQNGASRVKPNQPR